MKNIKRYYILNSEPKDVYNALTNKTMLEIWTGEPAEMEPTPGTGFSLWGGSISGVNMSLKRIKKLCNNGFLMTKTPNRLLP